MKTMILTLAVALSLVSSALADHQAGHKVLVLKNKEGASVLGYDAVAYFTDNEAVDGSFAASASVAIGKAHVGGVQEAHEGV